MFIGHFGVALAAKKAAPKASLALLIFATQFVDLLWPILLLLGVEHVVISPGITRTSPLNFTDYPISHSLVMGIVWGLAVGGTYYAFRRYSRGAWIAGFAVLSHWVLDFLVHRPDLPLWPGNSPRVGLGLWNSWAATTSLEIFFFGGGLLIYLRTTRARDAVGQYAFWSLMILLLVAWLGAMFGSPPPNVRVLAWVGVSLWLIVPWAWWADRHRELRTAV